MPAGFIPELRPPSSSKALIFDCDGTIALTRHAHFAALRAAFASQGLTIDEDWYLSHSGLSLDKTCDALARQTGRRIDTADIRNRHLTDFYKHMPLVRPVDALRDVVTHYHGVLPMAVASAGDETIVRSTLGHIGLAGHFDAVVAMRKERKAKPDPCLFLIAADMMNVPATACYVYEDSDEGMEAAQRAGMAACDVRRIAGVER